MVLTHKMLVLMWGLAETANPAAHPRSATLQALAKDKDGEAKLADLQDQLLTGLSRQVGAAVWPSRFVRYN